jgi:site-specific DNA-methyltransferase (adenine-specific)
MGNLRPRPPRAELARRDSRATPPELYAALDAEFRFTLDPCPYDDSPIAGAPLWGRDGTAGSWAGERVYCNPPYSDIAPWLAKAHEADVTVYLLPVKSDTPWWHDHVMRAGEVRFIRGRLRFGGMSGGAPFPSAVVVFWKVGQARTRWRSMPRPPRAAAK